MTAIYGYNFCAGAIKSFALIIANIARAAVLDQVTNLVLFMGKVDMEHLLFYNQLFTFFFRFSLWSPLQPPPSQCFLRK